jgi:hypothetical protein
MRGRIRAGRAFALGVVLAGTLALAPGARAQALHEIMDGSIGGFPTDIFECGRQRGETKECGVS